MRNKLILNEDFKDFKIGDFPFDREHSAMGEYHLYPNKGYMGKWYDPVCNYNYRGPSWIVTENEGMHYMEQMRIETDNPHITYPTLMTGNIFWSNYTVQARIRILNTMLKGSCGIGFNCINSLNLLVFVFEDQKVKLLYRHKEEVTLLSETEFEYDGDTFYCFKAEIDKDTVKCYIDNILYLTYKDDLVLRGGKVVITSTLPAKFTDIKVNVDKDTLTTIEQKEKQHSQMQKDLQEKLPKMKLIKRIDLKDFGTGRQIRFGHLMGNDEYQIVMAQCQKRIHKDSYALISCLTAIDLEGNVLWQIGEPSENESFAMLSADIPLQIYDIDNDGYDEVITCIDFEILILDGRTGVVKKRVKSPLSTEDNGSIIGIPFNKYAFNRLNPDGLRIANFSGNEHASDILIKDRYNRVYALNKDLEVIWKYQSKKNIGHFPYAFDINDDGKDELFCGYELISSSGKLIWSLPIENDHTDEIIAGKFAPNSDKGYFALASGTEGFMIVDFEGNIIKKDGIGHAQRVSVANYRPDDLGYEICVTNYWGHQGIIYLYNYKGEIIWEMENQLNGNILAPVNWVGDGTDLILLNADIKKGGLIDGSGNIVVAFPDDKHPTLCVEAIDLYGDSRDELVVWDKYNMYIYTQDNNPIENAYKPVKYPHHNASNYRGEYSFPDESYIFEKQRKK